MYAGFITIFMALFIGYLLPVKKQKQIVLLNAIAGYLVFVILGLMGINLATIDNLLASIDDMLLMVAVFFIAITLCNGMLLLLLDVYCPIKTQGETSTEMLSVGLAETGKVILSIALGFTVGWAFDLGHAWINVTSEWLLHVLLLVVGMQLRSSGMTLRQIVMNKRGVVIALCVMVTSLAGSAIASYFLNIPLAQGLALGSGFGWYSLAGVLMTDAYGPLFGAVSFLNEVMRELAAFLLIPMVIKRYPHLAIGTGGATTLDFTLPIIQKQGGVALVPMAIVSGFILSVAVPILMGIFTSL